MDQDVRRTIKITLTVVATLSVVFVVFVAAKYQVRRYQEFQQARAQYEWYKSHGMIVREDTAH